jgi:hypothetical protein
MGTPPCRGRAATGGASLYGGIQPRAGPAGLLMAELQARHYRADDAEEDAGKQHRLLKDEGVRRATQLDHVLAEEGLVLLMNGRAVSLPIPLVR